MTGTIRPFILFQVSQISVCRVLKIQTEVLENEKDDLVRRRKQVVIKLNGSIKITRQPNILTPSTLQYDGPHLRATLTDCRLGSFSVDQRRQVETVQSWRGHNWDSRVLSHVKGRFHRNLLVPTETYSHSLKWTTI